MVEEVIKGLKYDRHFDTETKRHYVNKTLSVLHCHHYTSLYCQLAIDADETDLLQESARSACVDMLNLYFSKYCDNPTQEEKIEACAQYYSLIGLGKMNVTFMGSESGEIELVSSHTDAGWMKKWGKYDKPVNFISAGYIEAMFEVCMGANDHVFHATETQSIVMGAETSKFKVTRS